MAYIPLGKLSNEDLLRFVFPYLGKKRSEVLLASAIGEDSAVLSLGDNLAVLTCDPITGTEEEIGWLAVQVACNDLAACGAEPVGILLTILLPPDFRGSELEEIMKEVSRASNKLQIEVIGGHTEVVPFLPRVILVTTAIGKAPPDGFISTRGALPGDSLFVSKALALEGTAILAKEFSDELMPILGEEVLSRATSFLEEISVVQEGLLGRRLGVHAMHDITEGGVIAGAWEIHQASGWGVVLNPEAFPFRPETELICQALEADPHYLLSSGSMLFAAPESLPLVEEFAKCQIPLSKVGRVIEEKSFLLEKGDQLKEFYPQIHEELWRVLVGRKNFSR